MNKRGLIVTAFLSVLFALIFIVVGGFRLGFSVKSVLASGGIGVIFGMICAPELAPKAFRYPRLWQVLFTVLGATLLAFIFNAGPEGYAFAIAMGVVLGYLAPYWIKHVQGP